MRSHANSQLTPCHGFSHCMSKNAARQKQTVALLVAQ